MGADLKDLEEAIGYHFRDPAILQRALTHSSRARENGAQGCACDNEQLEFLGDSVLGLLVSEALLVHFPDRDEGRLSRLKSQLVRGSHLMKIAEALGLGDYLLLSRGEEMSGGRTKPTILADALEAVIAAVYLDGGLEAARGFVARTVTYEMLQDPEVQARLASGFADFKGLLQELARERKLPQPRYIMLSETGPGHARTFTMQVQLGHDLAAQGTGRSKKTASQMAARLVLEKLQAESEIVSA